MPEGELIKIIGNYEGLVVRSATKVNANVINYAKNMRVIGRAGVGVDNIDVAEATKRGILVMNTPGGNTVSTAQLAVSLLCSLAREIPAADMSIKQGKWERKAFLGVELNGKTLGIIGCGRIGQVVASCARSLGMNVLGYDPVMSLEAFQEVGLQRADLEDIWLKSDFITVHTPLTPETANLLNDTTIAKCKTGVRLINCARGGIIDEAALLRALESGKVAGAALDVYSSEPPKEHLKPLLAHPKVICTPHLGASTDEAQVNVARDIAVQMCDLFEDRDFVGVMNVSYIAASTQPFIKPFMALSEMIGSVLSQLAGAEVTGLELKTWGGRDVNITTRASRQLLEAMLLKGFLTHSKHKLKVGFISAPFLAKEVGLKHAISSEAPDGVASSPYWNMVSVDAQRADGSVTRITGSVFGATPHLTQIDDFRDLFAFKPDGKYVLTFRNDDRPGAISEVLAVLSKAKVNVASVNVARATVNATDGQGESKPALCFMALDDDLPAQSLQQLQQSKSLRGVSMIHL
jgi:D-3-phosphoglycerate dehydrogenase / 2-oxoglutarate reductase